MSNENNPINTNDPEELRRDIARTRGNLSQNVNALGEAVDPSNVARRQAEKVEDRVKGVGRGIKERIMGSDDDYYGEDPRYGNARYAGDRGYGYGNDERGMGDRVSDMGDRVSDAASDAGDRLRGAADQARYSMERAPERVRRQAQGNPLAAGLIALGAGWLLGSLLPATDRERELAVRAKETAQEKGQPLVEEAKSVAQESAENLKAPLADAGESLKSSAQDSVEKVKGEAQDQAGDVKAQAQDSKNTVQDQARNN
ncbi:DUF3618 domain-containing protein [Mobilicoccus massiliensis]|uniref:DUF3618 domain-containing protein n=1 Tax=Mobilicoccus massiliensis TaxID=1522310 RepID=UPI00069471F5|nr:DUF3618 domain-containing protein [Mobilicoccus massiliensis]